MVYIITIRIPIKAYKDTGVDRDKFLDSIKKNVGQYLPDTEVDIIKGIEEELKGGGGGE